MNLMCYKPKRHAWVFMLMMYLLLIGNMNAGNGTLYTSDKLTCSQTSRLCQDKYGFIWVGTEYGLNKFDGYHFTNYFFRKEDRNSICSNDIAALFTDRQRNLWIGTSMGLCRYDYRTDRFVRYPIPTKAQTRVSSIIQLTNGDILLGTSGSGLFCIRRGTNHVIKEDAITGQEGFFSKIFEDSRHCLWRTSHRQDISRYVTRNHKILKTYTFISPCGKPVNFIEWGKQSLLVICYNGIMKYDYASNKMSDGEFDLTSLGRDNRMYKAIKTNNGDIYIATAERGVMVIRKGGHILRQLESCNGKFDLSMADVNDVIEDKDHNIWASCYNKGLYQINQYRSPFNDWSFFDQKFIISSSVSSMAQGDSSDILCAVSHNGIYRFDSNGKITAHPASPSGTNYIYRDRRGHYWICTAKSIYSYNPTNGSSHLSSPLNGLCVKSISDNGTGTLYISDLGKGLLVLNTMTGTKRVLTMTKGEIVNDWVMSLSTDRQGLLWIGTCDGISCLDTHNGKLRPLGWAGLLRGHRCDAICETDNGEIILGMDNGLYIYKRKSGQLSTFMNAKHITGKKICAITADRDGDLWISTTMGLWQYNHTSRQFVSYTGGEMPKEYMHGAMIHLGNDMIGFGTSDGITAFFPREVKHFKNTTGHIYLTKFIVDNKTENCFKDQFKIPYDENSCTMEFSTMTYRNAENIVFQYRLNGGLWISNDEGDNRINFNKLKSGQYTLQVRAMLGGTLSGHIKTIHIKVENPWYASTTAIGAYFLAIALAAFMAIHYYERKRELEEAKIKFLINTTHDIRSPLTLILGPLQKLKGMMTSDEGKNYLETINRNANRLLLLVNQILDQRKIDRKLMKLHCRQTDLVKSIGNICLLFDFSVRQRGIKLTYNHDAEEIPVWIDRINFDKVMSNIISNALKYTPDGGEIDITLTVGTDKVKITVTDNGIGLDGINTDNIFDSFYQGANAYGNNISGTGIGLSVSRMLIEMHSGNITAHKRDDGKQGACFDITLPLGNSHLKPEEIDEEPDEKKTKKINSGLQIMIVDDDPEISMYISNELGSYYHISSFSNGNEALHALLTNHYDLVVSDVVMPGMDGIELLKRIKGNNDISETPVILLTSKTEVSDRIEGLKRGADAFIAKPFDIGELRVQIDNLVDSVRRLRGKFSGAQKQEDKVENIEMKNYNDELMDRIMKVINENIANADFNVDKLCKEAGISRTHLHRKLKEIIGIGASDFLRNLRLDQAARLIIEHQVNISEVAYHVGFTNRAHFSTVFKKRFGVTPKEYVEKKISDEKH